MAATWAWARLDLRRRWRSLVVLALVTAAAGTVTMTAFAGANRADSALDRLSEVTEPATVAVRQLEPGFDWSTLEALPYVEAIGRVISGGLGELGDGISADALVETPTDAGLLFSLEQPVVLSGRVYRTDAADEAVVTQRFADRWGREVGDTVELQLPAPRQIGMGDAETGPLRGDVVDLRIVGVIRTPFYADWPGEVGIIIPSPGVAAAHPQGYFGVGGREEPSASEEALVRLAGGAADVDRFRADLARLTGRSDLNVQDLSEQYADRQHSIDFEARSLTALGVAAALASLVLVGQMVLRHVAGARHELPTASALGLTRLEAGSAVAFGPVVAGAAGTVVAIGGAVLSSRLFPIGTAALIEPEPGIRLDPWVLTSGGVLLLTLTAFVAACGAIAVTRSSGRAVRQRRSGVGTGLAKCGLPLPVVVGSRLALEPGRGALAVPVRSTLLASVAGILGLVAVLVVGSGVSDAVEHPERFGQTFDSGFFTGFGGFEYIPTADVAAALAQDDRVVGLASPRVSVATAASGTASVTLFSQEESTLPVDAVVLSGRSPESADEVLLAPASAADLGVTIGDEVSLAGTAGESDLRVVGIGLLTEGISNRFDEGGSITAGGFDQLFAEFDFRVVLVELTAAAAADSTTNDQLTSTTLRALPEYADSGFELGPVSDGRVVQQLAQVQPLPVALAAFLVLLACGALAHALLTTVRRRAKDLATLRAIGMTPVQTSGAVLVQAVVIAAVGLVVGAPLGFALGRTVWRSVASYTPLDHVAPAPLLAVAGMVPAVAIVAALLAWWPGRQAARCRVADNLRTE
ncbi:MAG: ABC transporter permease [Nocardioides sp.]